MKYVKMFVVTAFCVALAIFVTAEIRELKNRDTTDPVIVSDREMLEIPCDYTEEQLLEGLSASDAKDGDLTSKILVGEISRFIEKGVSNVNYVVFDSANKPAVLNRKVKFTDYKSPEFKLSKPLVFTAGQGDMETVMKMITAKDCLDDNVSKWITRTASNINFQKEGTYQITVETGNKYGDQAAAQLPVHIIDAASKEITIELMTPIVYADAGEGVDPMAFVNRIYTMSGDELDKDSVRVKSGVKEDIPGTYEIHYLVEQEDGSRGETWLTVIVRA